MTLREVGGWEQWVCYLEAEDWEDGWIPRRQVSEDRDVQMSNVIYRRILMP